MAKKRVINVWQEKKKFWDKLFKKASPSFKKEIGEIFDFYSRLRWKRPYARPDDNRKY